MASGSGPAGSDLAGTGTGTASGPAGAGAVSPGARPEGSGAGPASAAGAEAGPGSVLPAGPPGGSPAVGTAPVVADQAGTASGTAAARPAQPGANTNGHAVPDASAAGARGTLTTGHPAETASPEALAGSTAATAHPGAGSAGTAPARAAASFEALAGSTAVTAHPGAGSAGPGSAEAARREALAGSTAVTAHPGSGSAGTAPARAAGSEALAGSTAVTAHPGSGSAGTGSARAASLEALAGSTAVTAHPGAGSAGAVPARAARPEVSGPTGSPDNPGATPRTSTGGTGLDGTRTVLPAGASGGATASAPSTSAGTASPQGRPASAGTSTVSAPSVPAGTATAAGRPATAHQASAGTATASAHQASAGTATASARQASAGTATASARPVSADEATAAGPPATPATAPNPPASPDTAAAQAHARPTRSALSPKVEPVVVRSGAALVVPAGASAAAVGAPDFRRITAARVGAVAVPVAAVVRVARRKNVIGAETTGSIPVHLLFRDEPDTAAAPLAAGEDDGGPDTVAMAVPTPPPPSRRGAKGRGPAIPAPQTAAATTSPGRKTSRQQSVAGKAAASRPVPSADPALVERPGPVLPGWVGVAGGALALAGCAAVVWWAGAVPEEAARMLRLPERPYHGIHLGQWALLALGVLLTLFAVGGLGRGRVGYAWVLTLFGDYRGTVRRTGLVWVSPLLLRRRVDVRLRHWRSEPLSAVDAKGTALDVVVLVVWRVRDTVRAALGVDGHEEYLREQVEAAMARVLSQLPADAFHEDAPTLRDAEAVGEALTRMLSAECAPVGVDVFSAQPTRIEYAPEVAAAMTRRRIAAIDAKHRDSVLTSVVDAVDDVVHRLTSRGLVELDDYERKALVKDLTVAFYTGRTGPVEGA
ncbi:hypothetical protein DEJ45_23090 [Streptomyces venezuelae]|nr:hypothetical protein DEJ45_23090 [Streptomyces venezuelae]